MFGVDRTKSHAPLIVLDGGVSIWLMYVIESEERGRASESSTESVVRVEVGGAGGLLEEEDWEEGGRADEDNEEEEGKSLSRRVWDTTCAAKSGVIAPSRYGRCTEEFEKKTTGAEQNDSGTPHAEEEALGE